MAQYDIILAQNVASSGVEYTERNVLIQKGGLLSADSGGSPAVLAAGTNTYMLVLDSTATTGIKWQAQPNLSQLHDQNTDTGTTASFGIDTDGGASVGLKLKAVAGNLEIRNLADDAYADITVKNLTVKGSSTVIESATIQVADKNIEIGKVTTPTDITADGGGITLLGTTDKTILWNNATDAWDFNQNINLSSGFAFKINGNPITPGDIGAMPTWVTAPATKTSTGTMGTVAEDDNFFYVCTATNVWRRSPLVANW
jgi:hypothetical protein